MFKIMPLVITISLAPLASIKIEGSFSKTHKDIKWAISAKLKDIEPTLCDLNKDPGEKKNLAFYPRYRPILNALRTKV